MKVWRDRLKTGPLGGVYSAVRRAKRKLRGEPLAGLVPFTYTLADKEELRELIAGQPEQPRLYYSLALDYLENPTETNLRYAEACLRCASALGFESEERITLYRAQIMALCGNPKLAGEKIAHLHDYELTAAENILRERLLTHNFPPPTEIPAKSSPDWQAAKQTIHASYPAAESLLICDDAAAITADWLPEAHYLFAVPQITGLTFAGVAKIKQVFAVGIGSAESQQNLAAVGVRCSHWIVIGNRD